MNLEWWWEMNEINMTGIYNEYEINGIGIHHLFFKIIVSK